jgi:hypothetical protein
MPWYEYTAPGGGIARPMVQVVLWHGAKRVRILALVDSGADTSLVNVSFAEVLGLDRAEAVGGTSITAGGESMECLRWPKSPIEIQFEGHRFPFMGEFSEFRDSDDGLDLLGREDFFDRFIISFWDSEGIFNIDESPYYARPPLLPRLKATARRRPKSSRTSADCHGHRRRPI